MKKLYLITIILLLAQVTYAVNVEIDNIAYNINLKTGLTEVTSNALHPYTGNIVIPEKIVYEGKEYTVTAIGTSAFFQCKGLTAITFPNSITSIGSGAFMYCQALDSIALPEKITVLETNLFASCESLRHVVIPDGVTSIGNSAFNSCSVLDSIKIPDTVTTIEDWAFANCDYLSYVEMPKSLSYAGRGAFGSCYALKSVRITDLSSWAMANFYNSAANPLYTAKKLVVNDEEVTDLVIPDNVKSIGNCAFVNCQNVTSITIGDSTTTIGSSSFYGCSNVTKITIGENVTNIGGWAFYGCSKATEIISLPRKVPSTGSNAFDTSVQENTILYVPGSAFDEYSNQAPWIDFWEIKTLDIPKHQLTYYVDDALYKSYTLEEGEFITPEPEPEKDGYTFSGWSEIPERMPKYDVTVTGSLILTTQQLTIDGIRYTLWVKDKTAEVTGFETTDDFSGRITIPSTVQNNGKDYDVVSIGSAAFSGYEKLTAITIGESVMQIGERAFEGCMLQHVFMKNTSTHLALSSFSQATYNHAMLYIPTDEWANAVYHGDLWRFINIRETVTNASDLSSKKAYTLMSANTFKYMVYDAVNDRTTTKDAYYQVDENTVNNCWQIVTEDGLNYLYNIGAKKFARPDTDGSLKLTETPVAITMGNSENGITFGDGLQTQWAFVLNDKVSAKDISLGVETVIDNTPDDDCQYYSPNGMKIKNPRKGLFIMKTKNGKVKKIGTTK